MQSEKSIEVKAKRLVELSIRDNLVALPLVEAILSALRENPPRHYKKILRHYMRYLARFQKYTEGYLSYAGELDIDAMDKLKNDVKAYYKRPILIHVKEDTALIAGFRIAVGDDIWDSSVAGRLAAFSESIQ